MVQKIDKNVLHPTWLQIYEAVGEDDDSLLRIWDSLSGQQLNLPTHLNSGEAVERVISDMVRNDDEEIDVGKLAETYGYSRRWIRMTIQQVNKDDKE